jgi:hypothetical protein
MEVLMERLKRSVLLGVAVSVAGCGFVHEPTAVDVDEDPVVVHAVLAAGSDRAAVLLVRVGPEEYLPGETYEYGAGIEPVSGAEVRLVAGSDTVRLSEAPAGLPACFGGASSPYGSDPPQTAGPGCYTARLPREIRSGTMYRLRIRLPDGRTIEGEAVPPPPVAGLELEPEGPVPVRAGQSNVDFPGQVRVHVRASDGAAGVGLAIQLGAAFRNGEPAPEVECGVWAPAVVVPLEGERTAVLPIYSLACLQGQGAERSSIRPDSVHARLSVTAYGDAFMRYREALQEEQVARAAASQGITGALGLFAGEATVERLVTLVPTD